MPRDPKASASFVSPLRPQTALRAGRRAMALRHLRGAAFAGLALLRGRLPVERAGGAVLSQPQRGGRPRVGRPSAHRLRAVRGGGGGRGDVDWGALWAAGVESGEAFDAGGASPAVVALCGADWLLAGGRRGLALVPGCGRGYEVGALAASGAFARVVGLDSAAGAAAAARAYLRAQHARAADVWEVECGDFFAYAAPRGGFRLVLDYTFLVALRPAQRPAWAARMRGLVAPGGSLVTLLFPVGKPVAEDGPPYGVSLAEVKRLVERHGFAPAEAPRMLPPRLCHPGREGATAYARWVRVAGG